jgi:dUTPase
MGGFSSKVVWGQVQDTAIGGSLEDLNTNPLEELVIEVELAPNAVLPDYATTGAASMQLLPIESVQLVPGIPKLVDTGVKLDLPFMLVAHITGSRSLAERRVVTHSEYLSCDSRGSIHVLLTLALGAEPHWLEEHEPIGMLTILPCARPELQRCVEL